MEGWAVRPGPCSQIRTQWAHFHFTFMIITWGRGSGPNQFQTTVSKTPPPPDRSSYSVEEQAVRVSAEDRTDNIFGIDTCRNMQLCNAAVPHWVPTILNDCSRFVSRYSLMNSPTQTTVRQSVSFGRPCSTSSVFDWLVQGEIFYAVNASRRKWQINTEKRRNTLVSAHLNQCP